MNCKKDGGAASAYEMKTAPYDPRFPQTNQTRYCFQMYCDWHRCRKLKGEDYEPCSYFQRVYRSICPNAWIAKWDDQVAAGTFPGQI